MLSSTFLKRLMSNKGVDHVQLDMDEVLEGVTKEEFFT